MCLHLYKALYVLPDKITSRGIQTRRLILSGKKCTIPLLQEVRFVF